MKKEKKNSVVSDLLGLVEQYPNFYLVDIEALPADLTSNLRRLCFEKGVKLMMVKNSLVRIALTQKDEDLFSPLFPYLKGNTAIMFAETANAPARLIKDFTKEHAPANPDKKAKPELKAAYVQESLYLGAEKLEELVNVKSKEELIGDILSLLDGPIQGVVSALESAGGTIHGLLQTLEERG
ncbi:MAG: 50S ribosomal protein L10 [Porphyromonas sp.]|nr:50S ribosomal protein L10 [Porphyromonas sp.]